MRILMAAAIVTVLAAPSAPAVAAPQGEPSAADAEQACAQGIRELKTTLGYEREGGRTTITAEDGRPQTYVGEGPAPPVDAWFEAGPYPHTDALHALNDAMAARADGDHAACRQEVARAQGILDDARQEHRGD